MTNKNLFPKEETGNGPIMFICNLSNGKPEL